MVDDGIQLLDRRQPPVAVPGQLQLSCIFARPAPASFPVFRGLLPHEPCVAIRDRAVAVVSEGHWSVFVLGILAIERTTGTRAADLPASIETFLLTGSHDDEFAGSGGRPLGRGRIRSLRCAGHESELKRSYYGQNSEDEKRRLLLVLECHVHAGLLLFLKL